MVSKALLALATAMLLGQAEASSDSLSWLRADGTRIVREDGTPVVLRGVNLGGWLVEEMWMMPFVTSPPADSGFRPVRDHVSLWAVIEKRLGRTTVMRVKSALRDAWLSEADFDRIHDAGFNCVRLPFLHDVLAEPDGFGWLDRAVKLASNRGLYVILDMHGAPGRQSRDHHTGEEGVNRLFCDAQFVAEAERLWAAVARRYRNNPAVAAYNLLNEPMGAPNTATLYLVQDRLYRAVRAEDKRHMIVIEDGYTGLQNMPRPSVSGWTNVVYSSHYYQFDARAEDDHRRALLQYADQLERLQAEWGVPFYLGEFNLEPRGTPATMLWMLNELQRRQWSWSVWSYKVVMKGGDKSMWGLYRNTRPVEPIDPFRDSEQEIVRKLQQVRTDRLDVHAELLKAYRSAAGLP
ncbi:MAG: glycoside hydrolase family 5 protein [Armatimonadota bacterium]